MRMQYLLDARHTSGRVRSPSPEGVGGHGRLVLLTSGETHRVKPAPSTWVDAEPIRSYLAAHLYAVTHSERSLTCRRACRNGPTWRCRSRRRSLTWSASRTAG